jgi:hypothetical protein
VAGEHRPGQWREIIHVGERFHAALAGLPRPDAIIDARADPWAVGDRVAWGEAPFPELDDVLSTLHQVDAPSQLIHGDLTGNVLSTTRCRRRFSTLCLTGVLPSSGPP